MVHVARLKPKRRCRIPRRPHPDLDELFGRYARAENEPDEAGSEATDLEPLLPH